jgi:hypothetical protein
MPFDYIKRTYDVPAELGRRVVCSGKPGVITKDLGHYIGVVLDDDASQIERPYHPTSEVAYGGLVPRTERLAQWRCLAPWREAWETEAEFMVQASTRSKARYKAWLVLCDVCDLEPSAMLRIRVRRG